MMSPDSGTTGGAPPSACCSSNCQLSVAILRCFMIEAIHMLLERFDAYAPHDVDKTFLLAVAALEIDLDQLLDHVRHLGLRNRRPQHLAQRSIVALGAADRDL